MGRPKNIARGGAIKDASLEYWSGIAEAVKKKAVSFGLGPVEIAEPRSSTYEKYAKWVADGMHGEMGYLARDDRMERRKDLSVILPGVQSVLVCGLLYWPGRSAFLEKATSMQGDVSCYAWGTDYHTILGDRLRDLALWMHEEAGGTGKWYVDTGAILERSLAEQSGLGFIGKNTMLINPRYGSGMFLGEILTTLPLPASPPKKMPGCGKCTKCQVACPTDAFDDEYVLDARKCISYLTIELKGEIPVDLRPKMGRKVYGCDICQEVCPWNKFDWDGDMKGTSPLFGKVAKDVRTPDLERLIRMTESEFKEWFAGTAAIRIGRDRLRRNAAVALGNSRDPQAIPVLKDAINDNSELVRSHSRWALDHLLSQLRTTTS
ncbi:hypothetical protein NDN08_004799 [Rhodosorus marinus]|uniref:4Fe-4S ferredoxin-type domain-containing protein n=1 Tax=Rhodosorus marinus TaxID=101924 RepID=A0AAV8URI8_9RHOD|nr:hypothetical protein NDN08_004799 [Rhodosorus marinus]